MTDINLEALSLDELRLYVLRNPQDTEAFHLYIDRSKASGRMITVNSND